MSLEEVGSLNLNQVSALLKQHNKYIDEKRKRVAINLARNKGNIQPVLDLGRDD